MRTSDGWYYKLLSLDAVQLLELQGNFTESFQYISGPFQEPNRRFAELELWLKHAN